MSLFMGGVVQAFEEPRLRLELVTVAALLSLGNMAQIVALPALWNG